MPSRKPAAPPRAVATGTRERIADAALAMFNAEGAHAVSTRHVADRLGISPGNLYYHFDNKEEIVLHLCARIESELDALLAPPVDGLQSFDAVLGYLDAIFDHLRKFRFFYRDLHTLLHEAPGLVERYRSLSRRVHERSRALFAALVARGWMDATDEQLDLLATNAWIVLTQWFTHRQLVDRRRTIQPTDIREGIRHLVALFSPMLRPPQRRQVQRLVAAGAR